MVVVRVNRINRQSKIDMINVKPSTPTEQYREFFYRRGWKSKFILSKTNVNSS